MLYFSKNHKTSQCPFIPRENRIVSTSFRKAKMKQRLTRPMRRTDRLDQEDFRPWNRPYCGNSPQETKVSMTVQGSSVLLPLAHESSETKNCGFIRRLQSFNEWHVALTKKVRTVGGDARKFIICCRKKSDISATSARSAILVPYPKIFHRHVQCTELALFTRTN